jgi:hypothetical protein
MYTGELSKEYDVETDAIPLMSIANKYQICALVKLNEQKFVDRFKIDLPLPLNVLLGLAYKKEKNESLKIRFF